MKIQVMKALSGAILCFVVCGSSAQTNTDSSCKIDPPTLSTNAPNIFDSQQEQDLGDALAEYVESDMRVMQPAPNDELTRIGGHLLSTLPPTGIKYRFRIYESGEINGFSLAGGRVYISRKLIAAVKTEDELAGVLAHEIGHIWTHQSAIEFTRLFRIRLGITKVGDRADIFAKVHQAMSTPPKAQEEEDLEEREQLVADRIAIYAMVKAGYAPESFASFFNQVAQTKAKTGNWLTDVLGLTKEANRRYRTALKLIATLPESCKATKPNASTAFQAWLESTKEERVKLTAEGLSKDKIIKLDSPLRPSLSRIRFSPDGRYILAQNEEIITVINRKERKALFQIDAPDADAAQFTPDSTGVVFNDTNLRVEHWNVASGQRTSVKELIVYADCYQRLLAKNGKTFVCVTVTPHESSLRVGFRLLDVDSGKALYEKQSFYEPDGFNFEGVSMLALAVLRGYDVVTTATSPDGRYLVLSIGLHMFAYDFDHLQPVELGGKLKGLLQTPMSFVAPTQLAVQGSVKKNGMFELRILSFPDGHTIKEAEIGDHRFEAATQDNTLIISPLKDYNVGILDITQNKVLFESKLFAVDEWESQFAMEDSTGGIMLTTAEGSDVQHIPLQLGPLPRPKAAAFSPDGKYVTFSLKNRAGIWELETGKQVGLIRPYSSVWIDAQNTLYGQFTKFLHWDAQELRMTMSPLQAQIISKLDENEWQYHDFEMRLKPLGKDKNIWRHASLEVKKMVTPNVAWSHNYPNETPAFWPAEDDRLVLAWDLSNDTVKTEIKAYPALQAQIDALKDRKKGLLLEAVRPETGEPLQQVIIPEADLTHGWYDVRRAMLSGDFVLARGEHGNTVIYRLANGAKIGEFFGAPIATDAGIGLIAAVNRENEVVLVEEKTGKEIKRFSLDSSVRVARIMKGKENLLLVLTADQVVHKIPLPN